MLDLGLGLNLPILVLVSKLTIAKPSIQHHYFLSQDFYNVGKTTIY